MKARISVRTETVIRREYSKLWDKVWWNRHMGGGEPTAGQKAAREIEKKYGREYLDPGDDVEWGVCLGKMMALAWVLGADWEGAGDT